MNSFYSSYNVNISTPGTPNSYDLAFDLWVTDKIDGDENSIKAEIMIWEQKCGDLVPMGLVPIPNGGIHVNGIYYDLYYSPFSFNSINWPVYSYLSTSITLSQENSLSLKTFIDHLTTFPLINIDPNYFITNVSFGTEIKEGAGELNINDYTVNFNVGIPVVGLVAYYPFNGNANDESGNGKDGNPVNSPTYVTDRFNNSNSALNLNGTNQYVSLPNSISILNDISISFWIKTSISDNGNWPSGTFVIDRDVCGTQREWSVSIGSGGKLQFNTGKVETDNVITSNLNINDDNWKHIVVIRNTVNQTKSIYINGQLDKSELFDKQGFSNNSINIFVGASVCATSTHHYYNGLIDDIRIYSRALNDTEIQQLFNQK